MKIKGIDGLTTEQFKEHLLNGGRFVIFERVISVVVMTFKRSSSIYFIKPGESATKAGIPATLTTLLLGWWGIPWGPIYSIGAIYNNLKGGKDVTEKILEVMNKKLSDSDENNDPVDSKKKETLERKADAELGEKR